MVGGKRIILLIPLLLGASFFPLVPHDAGGGPVYVGVDVCVAFSEVALDQEFILLGVAAAVG